MKLLSRVVWSEGMYLAPHHFQTQSRYFEDSIHFVASSLWFKPYGLAAFEPDPEALLNGTAAIRHARGVLPDGLAFNIPGSDPPPEPRAIASHFSATRDSQLLLLGIPVPRSHGRDFGAPESRDGLRFLPETHEVTDETSGRDTKPVELGRKNLRLLLDNEPAEALTTMPVARIRRDGSGRFVYDTAFIPPLLEVAGSDHLLGILRRLCDLLDEKGRSLAAGRAAGSESLADRYRRDLAGFWFLHTINSSLAVLRHELLVRRSHPEELYTHLARLAGGLSCFALDAHPRDVPAYDHDDLTATFEALDAKIRSWLNLMLPSNCYTIPLRQTQPYFFAGAVDDARFFDRSRWLLEVESSAGEANIIVRTPQLAKVCSERFIAELVRRAVPGMTLTHLAAPPPEVPAKVEAQYFSLTKTGPCWEDLVKTRSVGVYAPGDLPDAKLAIHIILER